MYLELLRIGIKRSQFRDNDAQAKQADSIFEAGRDAALRKAAFRCARCGYESQEDLKRKKRSALHVHHLDNDHHNNEPENHAPHCSLDHAYHHIGCDAPTPGGFKGWASQMRIAYVPEVQAEDLNQLQRAAGAALSSPEEQKNAAEILQMLGVLAFPVRDELGSFKAKDFAAGLSSLSDAEYERCDAVIDGLRVLFHLDILRQVGQEMLADSPLFPVKSWEGMARGSGV